MDIEIVTEPSTATKRRSRACVAVGDRLHAVAHRILRDLDLAEDASQQALLAIWRDLPSFGIPAVSRPGRTAPGARLLRRGPQGAPLGTEPAHPAFPRADES